MRIDDFIYIVYDELDVLVVKEIKFSELNPNLTVKTNPMETGKI